MGGLARQGSVDSVRWCACAAQLSHAVSLVLLQDSEMAIRSQSRPPRRQGNWQNKVLARMVLEALGYNPSKHFKRIKAPIFFRLASKDHLCPPEILHALLEKGHVPEVGG